MRGKIQTFTLVIGFIATTAPIAHLLEMGAKLSLAGPLWLGIQQNLYRGWGAVFGPVEILALCSSIALYVKSKGFPATHRAALIAAACYAAMLAVFFVFNAPVNAALKDWTPETLPANWASYRARWEIGHALAALLSIGAFVAVLRARFAERL